MKGEAHIQNVDGRHYRIRHDGRIWSADTYCDCILGPHWHEQATAPTRGALIKALRKEEPAAITA